MTSIKKRPEEVMLRNYLDFVEQRATRRKKNDQPPTSNLAVMYPEMAGLIQDDETLSANRLTEMMDQYRRVMSPSTQQPARRQSTYDDNENLLDDHNYYV